MIILIILVAVVLTVAFAFKDAAPRSRTPNFTVSRGGYESHLDFLEAHGFITEEDREFQREINRKIESGELVPTPLTTEELNKLFGKKEMP